MVADIKQDWVSRRVGLMVVVLCWAAAVVTAQFAMLRKSSVPGASTTSGAVLSEVDRLESRGRTTLLMFAHPQCPCTRAGLTRLRNLLAKAPNPVRATVYFIVPSGAPQGWERTDCWADAESIPHLQVVTDPDGATARRYGASTSGDVVIFDAAGKCLFGGGLTPRRGDATENLASDAALAALQGQPRARRDWLVFGCPLFDPPNPNDALTTSAPTPGGRATEAQ